MNKRLEMALRLLGNRRFHRLLDAGYGGGVFLPELARRAEELHGVDVHPYQAEVEAMAQAEGLTARLRRAGLCDTGYPDRYFDAVVCISVLEFIGDLRGAIAEIHRIVATRGTVILGFPGQNLATSLGYFFARTPSPGVVHKANYRMILAEASRHLRLIRLLRFPCFVPSCLVLYFAAEFERT